MKNIFTQATYSRAVFAFVLIVFTQTLCGQEIKMASDEIPYIKDSYTYKIVDNHEIQADVYRYPGEELRPGIIWLHGGALIIGTRGWLPSEQMKFYLKAGYTVISIDYRWHLKPSLQKLSKIWRTLMLGCVPKGLSYLISMQTELQ